MGAVRQRVADLGVVGKKSKTDLDGRVLPMNLRIYSRLSTLE